MAEQQQLELGLVDAFAEALAKAFPLTPQPGQAPPIPAAELVKREAAHREMLELLHKLEDDGVPPAYLIDGPPPGGFFIDDRLIENGQSIEYFGIPNPEMKALNQPAAEVLALYLTSIGGVVDLAEQSYQAYHYRNGPPPPLGTPRDVGQSTFRLVGANGQESDLPMRSNGNGVVGGTPQMRYRSMPG